MSSEFMGKTYRRMDDMVLDANLTVAGDVEVQGSFTPLSTQPNLAVQTLTESGAITINTGIVLLAHGTVVVAATLDAPTAGDWLLIVNSVAGDVNHTVTLPGGVTWDGTNDVATFADTGDALLVFAISATRWFVVANIGSVAFS